ncbi:MAG: glycosyltransferase family 4 protein [Rhodospirillales bacterium]|nr:glycosyltransferase family 4 protein [Rhodospirillales bacterium]
MRILIISHGHPAFSLGGAEIASHNLFLGLNKLPGVETFYLARASHPLRRHRGTPLMSLRQGERETFLHADDYDHYFISNRAVADLSGAFRQYLLSVKPDIVHFHHVLGLGVEALFEVRRTLPEARIVITFHEYLSICLNHGQMVKTARNQLCSSASPAECNGCFPDLSPARIFQRELFIKSHLQIADAFVSPSRFLIDRYVRWGLPADRFHMLENGIETAHVTPPREIAAGTRRARFGFFGQITQFKGVHVLLDAVGRVPRELWGEDAALCMFGGNLENQPEAFQKSFSVLVEKAGRRAKFYGSYRNDEMPRLMQQVDWVIVPSIWWENSPLVIQEAFLHGRPLIVADIGGMAEKVTHGTNGLHFRVGSAEDLADRIAEALTTPGLWERLREGAPKPISHQEAAEQHLALYRSLGSEASVLARPEPAAAKPAKRARRRSQSAA